MYVAPCLSQTSGRLVTFHPDQTQLINLVGNHDIGYGAEVDDYLLGRFEAAFGPTNTNLWIKDAESPDGQHLLVVANGQVLDPSRSTSIREKTWHHLNRSAKLAAKHNGSSGFFYCVSRSPLPYHILSL
jgi:hypothetical protein